MKYVLLCLAVFAIALSTTSCRHKADQSDPLYVEVIAIHDEVMPKMSTMHKLRKKLRRLEDSKSEKVLQLITNLEKADEGMMVWMSDFDPPDDKTSRQNYLEGQLISVKKMANDINSAISNAEAHLSNE